MSILSKFFKKKTPKDAEVTSAKKSTGVEVSAEDMKVILKDTETLAFSIFGGIKTLSEVITNSHLQEEYVKRFDVLIKETNASLKKLYVTTEEMKKFADIQTNNIAKSVSSMEHLSDTITVVSGDIKERLAITKGLSQAAIDGNDKVKQVLDMVKVLSDNMESIKTVIGSINAISAQTNMLAMNAAIEAAHAGQAGRGFSVVADEIRKLSEVTRSNAINITGTVKNTMASLDEVRNTVNKASETMVWIEEEVMKAASSFEAITQNMQKLDIDSSNMAQVAHSIDDSGSDLQKQSESTYNGLKEITNAMQGLTTLESQIKESANIVSSSAISITSFFHESLRTELELQTAIDASIKTAALFEKEPFPFTYMAIRDITWVARIRRLLDGALEKELDLSINHKTCIIGQWFENFARKEYGSMPVFQSLDKVHEEFHDLIKEIAAQKDRLSQKEQESKYAYLIKICEKLIDGLTKLRANIK